MRNTLYNICIKGKIVSTREQSSARKLFKKFSSLVKMLPNKYGIVTREREL